MSPLRILIVIAGIALGVGVGYGGWRFWTKSSDMLQPVVVLRNADAGALVALLHLVPPAIDLVADHRGLVHNQRAARHQLKQRLLRARDRLADPATKLAGNRVAFGATVKLSNVDSGEEVTYRILGADESDLAKGSISITSPLARSLLGKEVGDEVKVRMPGGERVYEVLEVTFK